MAKEKRVTHFLEPLEGEVADRPHVVFDLESKKDDTQGRGFTRPFMVGFNDGKAYKVFRNKPMVAKLPWYERAVARGGCIDQFMLHLLDNGGHGQSYLAGFDVYAHNMGSFDGLFLPAWLERNNQTVSYKIMPVHSRIQAIEIWKYDKSRYRGNLEAVRNANAADRKKYGYIRILDSFRIMPVPLSKIAKAFGLEGKLEHDLDIEEHDPLWEKYNEVDTVQLYQVLNKYKEMIALLGGEVGITAPATAIKLLRRQFMPKGTKINRNIHFEGCTTNDTCPGCAHEFFRSAYFGGRTEIFWSKGSGYYYDVNSSYPYSMTKPAPTGEMFEMDENEDFTRFAKNEDFIGFVRCTVEIPPETYLPPLPVQHGGKLKFPAGRFSGTWDWTELKVLGRIGAKILHVEKSVWIKGTRFLADYVISLYAMRKKGGPQYKGKALSEMVKIMLNSTFGKFGMDQNRVEMIIMKPGEPEPWELRMPGESVDHKELRKRTLEVDPDPERHRYHIAVPMPGEPKDAFEKRAEAEKRGDYSTCRWRTPEISDAPSGIYEHDSLVRIKDIRVDAAYIIPQIAAHITASSRILLWDFAMDIIGRGYKIFYSDTDSLLTDFGDYPHNDELGGLKKEYQEQVTIEAFAPKMYRLTKPTPFDNEHVREKGLQCETFCPGCLKDKDDKTIAGQHQINDKGKKDCLKKCPGCSCVKIMMKGFPKDFRTSSTIEKLQRGEEIQYDIHEKLGVLAKRGFRDTPRMVDIKKTLKSKYDKRQMQEVSSCSGCKKDKAGKVIAGKHELNHLGHPDCPRDTIPIVLEGVQFTSDRFQEVASNEKYEIPPWMKKVVHIFDPINQETKR